MVACSNDNKPKSINFVDKGKSRSTQCARILSISNLTSEFNESWTTKQTETRSKFKSDSYQWNKISTCFYSSLFTFSTATDFCVSKTDVKIVKSQLNREMLWFYRGLHYFIIEKPIDNIQLYQWSSVQRASIFNNYDKKYVQYQNYSSNYTNFRWYNWGNTSIKRRSKWNRKSIAENRSYSFLYQFPINKNWSIELNDELARSNRFNNNSYFIRCERISKSSS